MANNRMFLVHQASGNVLYLGKRVNSGWYGVDENIEKDMSEFFNKCYTDMIGKELDDWNKTQDDFVIGFEYNFFNKKAIEVDRKVKANGEVEWIAGKNHH